MKWLDYFLKVVQQEQEATQSIKCLFKTRAQISARLKRGISTLYV